jgi:hypothetical protein
MPRQNPGKTLRERVAYLHEPWAWDNTHAAEANTAKVTALEVAERIEQEFLKAGWSPPANEETT